MKFSNIILGEDVDIDTSSNVNYIAIGDRVRIAKRCSVFGGPDNQLVIGNDVYIGMNTTIVGFWAKITIGNNVSMAQNVDIMSASGPNASERLQRIFPIKKLEVEIGAHSWIGACAIIMPGVKLGEYCVVAANSFVNHSFPSFSIIGGNPAKLIRSFTELEIETVLKDNESK